MKMIKAVARNILKWTGLLILALLTFELSLYFLAPVYDFTRPQPFSGEQIYNPYKGMDSTHWRKANFHFHTRIWGGITSGRQNTSDAFYNTYKALAYDAPQISNYQSINNRFKDSAFYVPVYEHGFGIRKKHQILIGARKVLWLDYSLVQNLGHKQHMLNLLRPDNDIVALAHPDWEGGYSLNDMQYLTNYDLVEALNRNWRSLPQWDAALSAGKPVYILSDDDAHNISDPYEIQRMCTFINSTENSGAGLVKALKAGMSYGADIFVNDGENFTKKAKLAVTLPRVNSVEVKGDTLWVSVSGKPLKMTFIGQNGEPRKIVRLAGKAWYKFKPEDTYIRTEIVFLQYYMFPAAGPGTKFYLNPVFRYNGTTPTNALMAEINWPRTWILRILGFGSMLALAVTGVVVRKRRTGGQADKRTSGQADRRTGGRADK